VNISNLIFHADHPLAWHSAIRAHYPYVKREGVGPEWKLRTLDIEEIETTSVNMYKSGTVMVHPHAVPAGLLRDQRESTAGKAVSLCVTTPPPSVSLITPLQTVLQTRIITRDCAPH
jgi:hypothetical protein